MLNRNLLLLILLLLWSSASMAAIITVKADRNPVSMEESFRLIFEADGAVDDDPDFKPLQRNFEILSTSVSSNMSIVNSKITSTKTWTLTLFAKKEGKLEIPSVAFGKDRSPATFITVKQSIPGRTARQQGDIFVDLKVKPDQVYVQQELIVKVRLYRAVNIANASLSEPEVESGNAIIEHLEHDSNYETVIKGRRYLVLERSYAVYPQESGTIRFKPVRFQGQVSRQSTFIFDPFGPAPSSVVKQSQSVAIEVKPIPETFKGAHWLPATSVTVAEQWSKDPLSLQTDEPVTRTISVTAKGLSASQLPVITSDPGSGFKQYPDQPELKTEKSVAGSTGTRNEKTALIPTRAGNFVLPEIRIPWWNTETDRMEYAVLPERNIRAEGSAATGPVMSAPQLPDVKQTEVMPSADGADNEPDTVTAAPGPAAAGDETLFWKLLTLFLALCWTVTLYLLLKSRRGRNGGHTSDTAGEKTLLRRLRHACDKADAQTARYALLQWARLQWPEQRILSPGDVADIAGEELAAEANRLSAVLYGRDHTDWDGKALWSAVMAESKERRAEIPEEKGGLEPLYRI